MISLVDEAADSGATCTYVGPNHAEAIGHPVALKRAFRNVIDNALKYGGAARVSLAAEAPKIRITIEDNGPGIPPDRVEEVSSHGGTIVLTSAPTAGLNVTVLLSALIENKHPPRGDTTAPLPASTHASDADPDSNRDPHRFPEADSRGRRAGDVGDGHG